MKLGITFYFAEEAGVLVVEDGGTTPLRKDDVVLGCSYAKTDDVDLENTYLAPFLSTKTSDQTSAKRSYSHLLQRLYRV